MTLDGFCDHTAMIADEEIQLRDNGGDQRPRTKTGRYRKAIRVGKLTTTNHGIKN